MHLRLPLAAAAPGLEVGADSQPSLSQHRQSFWSSYLRIGFAILGGESVAALIYLVVTPRAGNRGLLEGIAAASAVVGLVGALSVGWIAARPWRGRFSVAWTLTSGLTLVLCAHLDSGIESPLLFLAALPVMSAALVLSSGAVTLIGLAALAGVAMVAATTPPVVQGPSLFVLLAALAGFSVLGMTNARMRARLERHESQAMAEVVRLASIDGLTGFLNSGAFYAQLQVEIDRALRYHHPLSLVVGDLDVFRAFNDEHGHDAGDEELARLGKVLARVGRSSDVVGRVGGDEFAVILPETDVPAAREAAVRIRDDLRIEGAGVTVSMGIASLGQDEEQTALNLFRNADAAMYEVKTHGRDAIRISGASLPSHTPTGPRLEAEDRRRLELRLRQVSQESAERLSLLDVLQSSSPVGLGFLDTAGRIVRSNERLAEVMGHQVTECLGHSVSHIAPELWTRLEGPVTTVIDTGLPAEVDEPLVVVGRGSATPQAWLTTVYPVTVGSRVIGAGLVLVDITERQEAENAQRRLNAAVVDALGATVEKRDPYTAGHQRGVGVIAAAVAGRLGCSADVIAEIELGSRVHDVGKVAVPVDILSRPGRLSPAELALVREHVTIGYEILTSAGFSGLVPEIALRHHERLDGSGYPDGLSGSDIGLAVRIVSVADVVEAMAAHRPYRPGLGAAAALDEITSGRGRLYDPDVVEATCRLVDEGVFSLGADER